MKQLLTIVAAFALFQGAAAQTPDTPESFIAGYAKEHKFSGTIMIEKKGAITYAESFGMANLSFSVPNSQRTKYKIASVTKIFTSTLILQLVEQGRIDLNRTISAYLPDYKGEAATKVTIHQLLNHTSGLPMFETIKSEEDAIQNGIPVYQMPHTSDALLALFCSGPLVNAPGKVFQYNNADYVVLGKIIEKLYGKTYEQVLDERIFQPLKLTNTGFLHQNMIVDNLADTYFTRPDLKALANDMPMYPENWYAAGALYSTPGDLLTFANALFGGGLLQQKSLDLMFKPGLEDYGYGLWSYDTKINGKSYRVVKRPGGIMGAKAELYHFLDADITIVMLGNTDVPDYDEFVAQIGKRVVN